MTWSLSAAETTSVSVSSRFAPPRHAPRGVLLSRHTTRYPSLVGLAMHAPERRHAQRNLSSTALVMGQLGSDFAPGLGEHD
jgi:hypothetical protein